ncbi:peptide ABC transporter substrate-binding protein [Pseudobacteroides cellulosolvens]|uniref:ABC-type transporter, periplasmic subunit n=1 Tax=Pseudobacteroides cellulosolvens ATCC 35603 = DSM 2933 TaxID=398512 RepID=A0A0L6JMK9_9FIRM|nr:peptide ABC transporter substrate-binding protein [Pseudobacteroides cellulosolvens]KNY27031.1 ABC-type transporter, periplasmic subunit [Pseudobacteroides cellulosolvens ATCC 35603 = DSM 2933]
MIFRKKASIIIIILIIITAISGCAYEQRKKQNLVAALEFGVTTLDPAYLRLLNEQYLACNLWEGLIRKNVDGSIEPGIAERYDVSEDGLKYTFYLRKGAKWSDGKPVTAGQFEYAWKRALNPSVDSSVVFMMYFLKNGEAYNKNKAKINDVGVKAIDDHTLEVTLEKPAPYFLEILSYHTYYPVRQDIVEKDHASWHRKPYMLVSNGPFYVEMWNYNEEIKTVKNPYYWDKENVKLDSITFLLEKDGNEIWPKYLAGEIDFGYVFADNRNNLMNEITTRKNNVISEVSLSTYYLYFNSRNKPFDNIKVRQAFELALDRKGLVKVRQKAENVATGFVPPGMPDVEPGSDFRLAGGEFMHKEFSIENISKAKILLKEAGYQSMNNFPSIVVLTKDTTGVEFIEKEWEKNLGVDIILNKCKSELFSQKKSEGDYDIVINNWIADFADPINFLGFLASENSFKGILPNEYYLLVEKSNAVADNAQRLILLHEAEKLLLDSYSLIPLFFRKDVYYIKPCVKNYLKTPLAEIYFRNAYIEE